MDVLPDVQSICQRPGPSMKGSRMKTLKLPDLGEGLQEAAIV